MRKKALAPKTIDKPIMILFRAHPLMLLVGLCCLCISCKKDNTPVVDPPETITDVDGNIYTTVMIEDQCWMAENLKTERYRNGDTIPTGLSNAAWEATTSGAAAVFDEIPANKATYGLLYNWYAVNDVRGICPDGWKVPSEEEWKTLTDTLGGTGSAGGAMKTTGTYVTGTGLWTNPNFGATNSSGFSGLPVGLRLPNGNFGSFSHYGNWWTATESEFSTDNAWRRALYHGDRTVYRNHVKKEVGFSVRCLKE